MVTGVGGSNQNLSSDEMASLTTLVADLADDYRLLDLPREFDQVTQAAGEPAAQNWDAVPTARELAVFIWQVGKYIGPIARAALERKGTSEAEIAEAAQEKFIGSDEMRSASIEKRGIIRRVVRTLVSKGPVQP